VSLLRWPELCVRLTPGRRSLVQGVSADTRWGEDDTPVLCIAAQRGSERALKALLDGRANHALADKNGTTAAHKAAYNCRAGCLRLLVDAGAELEAKSNGGFTPLHLAAHCCSPCAATPTLATTLATRR